MLEGKAGGLSVFIASTKLVGNVAVSLCFPMHVNGCSLAKMGAGGQGCCSNSSESGCFPSGSEESAVCYSLYLMVNQVLCGDPLATSKTKVSSVTCCGHNGLFSINWNVKGTVSAVRKSVGLALRVLNPSKMYAIYSKLVRELGGTPKKESFAYVASEAAAAIKSNLTVGIVGNINADKAKLDGMLDVLKKKHAVSAVEGSKTKPSDHKECDHSNYAEAKTLGWASAVLSDYLRFKVRGLNPTLCDKHLLLPMKQSAYETLAKKVKDGVKTYVAAKYTKIGDNLGVVFGYMTLSSGALCACDVKSMINAKVSAASVESAITKSL